MPVEATITPERSRHQPTTITPIGENESPHLEADDADQDARTIIRRLAENPTGTPNNLAEMTEETNKCKSVVDLITKTHGPEAVSAIKKPTKVDAITFKKQLANALLKCRGAPTLIGGHSHLILNESEYQKRISKPNAKLPRTPDPPDMPTGKQLTTESLKMFNRQEKAFELHAECEQQTLDLLTTEFPNSIVGLLDEEGNPEFGTTPKDMLDNMEKKPCDDDEINDAHTQPSRDVIDREHEINANGAEEWFKDAEADRLMMTKLGFDPIQHSVMMACAQQAFKKSGCDKKDTPELAKNWKKQKRTENLHDNTEKCYEAFKEFCNQELAMLCVNQGNKKTKHKACQTEELDEWRTTMEDNIQDAQSTAREIECALNTACDKLEGKSFVVPSNKSTATESSLSPDTQGVEERIINKLLARGWGPQPTQTDETNDRWRLHDEWCWSCGANFHHNTTGECRRKKDGHDQHATATHKDPQDGNTSRNHLMGKWCGPDDKTCVSKNGPRCVPNKPRG